MLSLQFAMAFAPHKMMYQQIISHQIIARGNYKGIKKETLSTDLKDIQDICARSLTDDHVRWIFLATMSNH